MGGVILDTDILEWITIFTSLAHLEVLAEYMDGFMYKHRFGRDIIKSCQNMFVCVCEHKIKKN